MAAGGESVVDVPPKLSARVRVISIGNARNNDGVDAVATALAASRNGRLAAVDPQDSSSARGGVYYRKKIAEGKSRKEALRCLNRDADLRCRFASLVADSQVLSRSAA